MTLIIDNPTVERVLKPSEVNDALELAALELATGGAINSPPYRVFTPRILTTTVITPGFPKGEEIRRTTPYLTERRDLQTGCHNGPHRLRYHYLFRTRR